MEGDCIATHVDRSALNEVIDLGDGWNANKNNCTETMAGNAHLSVLTQRGHKSFVTGSKVHYRGES